MTRSNERSSGTSTSRSSALNPQVQDLSVAQANAAFLPIVTSDFDLSRRVTPSRTQLDGAGRLEQTAVETDSGGFSFGLEQAVKWGGGRYSVAWDNTRSEGNNVFLSFNPSYGSNFSLNYTQPLLRGFSTDPQRRQLIVSQINPRPLGCRPTRNDRQHTG